MLTECYNTSSNLCDKNNKEVQISPQEQEANNNHFRNDRGQGEQMWDIGYQHPRENRSYGRQTRSVNPHKCSSSMKIPSFTGKDEWKVWINRLKLLLKDFIGMKKKNLTIYYQN
ncbi:hypothetical protein DPMN_075867 [Dreissena polymorpha]|uniref:Uncharacterized protein n=1 Tax=Dreissena polymorpha TaxID=45954 RepID=A0A9D3YLY5_DREPO|nr:hypothetical protein DPMN_075867 [Dreissena polymorpha]